MSEGVVDDESGKSTEKNDMMCASNRWVGDADSAVRSKFYENWFNSHMEYYWFMDTC